MSVSVRDFLVEQLTPLLPANWRIIPEQRVPQTIDQTTVIVKQIGISPLPQAPIGTLENEVTLTIVDPHEDWTAAENALDDDVLALCGSLDELDRLIWTGAKKVAVSDTYLGWDISLTVTTQKE